MIKEILLQNVDMGIAMCHFELASRELGWRARGAIATRDTLRRAGAHRQLDDR